MILLTFSSFHEDQDQNVDGNENEDCVGEDEDCVGKHSEVEIGLGSREDCVGVGGGGEGENGVVDGSMFGQRILSRLNYFY